MDGKQNLLELWDYVSLTGLVILSSLIGLYHIYTARKSKISQDFIGTNRELGCFPIILSIIATFYSAIAMLGIPQETYSNGISFLMVVLAFIIPVPIGCLFYLPIFYNLNRMSIFEGGIKAVVWADVTQCLVMITVVAIIIIKGTFDVGGIKVIWEKLKAGKRDELLIWNSSPNSQYSIWTMTIGASVYFLSSIFVNQSYMQRYLSIKTLKQAQLTMVGGSFGILIGQIVFPISGLIMYAHYHLCDPLLSQQISRSDQMMALFGVRTLSFCRGLPGVFVAGILCACLSTMSSMLNSLTAVTLSDYIKPFKPHLSDQKSIQLSKILTIIYGVICIGQVAFIEKAGGVLRAVFSIYGLTGGPVLTLFTIGMLFPKVNSKIALISFFSSLIVPCCAWLGNIFTSPQLNHAPYSIESCTNFTYNIVLSNKTHKMCVHKESNSTLVFHSFVLVCFLELGYRTSNSADSYQIKYDSYDLQQIINSRVIIDSKKVQQVDPSLLFSFVRKIRQQKGSANQNCS
ncbi:Sodium-coupled monocarboxylate transporter 1 [Chamberlinius hualienensis]